MSDTATGPPRTDPARGRWTILLLLMAFSFMTWFNRVSMSVAGTERLMKQYDISEKRMGMVYSAYLLMYTIFMTPGGWFIDRYGPKKALMVMGFGSAVFVALTGVVGLFAVGLSMLVWPAFLVIRASAGLVSAPIYPAAARSVSFWLPGRMGLTGNALVVSAAAIGIASTYYVFGVLMDVFGWPAAFAFAGLVTALITLAWALVARDRPPGVAEGSPPGGTGTGTGAAAVLPARPWYDLLRDRSLIMLTISYAAVGYVEYLFFFWIQHYFKEVKGLNVHESRLYATIATLALAVGMFAGGPVAAWMGRLLPGYGPGVVPVCGLLAGALLLTLAIQARQPEWILAWLSLCLACVGATEGAYWTVAVALGRERGGTSAAIFNTGGNVGGLLAPVVTPLFSDLFDSWDVALLLAGAVAVLGAVLWLWIDPNTAPHRNDGNDGTRLA
jgi:MFS family permease